MTNEQMYIPIGVPGILALVGILVNATMVGQISTGLSGRMGTIEARMGSVENRIVSVENRIAGVESRLLSFENMFTTRFDLLMGRLVELEKDIHNR